MSNTRIIDEDFISRLEAVSLYMQIPMQGYFGGNHRTKTYGNTVEFADFRTYQLGDDIRRIDWNVYSRFEKYFIRLFVDEKQMHTQIFLDCSASMGKTDPDKGLYAMRVAAALAFLSVKNMDKTSLKRIRGNFAEDAGGLIVGKAAFYRAVGELEETVFAGTADLATAITHTDSGADNGLTVIISDFLTESDWKKAVNYLLYRKRQVMLIQVLSPEELDPGYKGRVRMSDSEAEDVLDERNMKMRITRAEVETYRLALHDYLSDIKSFCAGRGVSFFSVRSDDPVEKLIFGKLNEAEAVR
ncbi:MAG: DUF58 domain-containing protein [Clostridiales bacterium]|jgi:uncharacterized protein (DUF58 family)|nr:DUF58 domain-containing protein [Clostridiales bacterium]